VSGILNVTIDVTDRVQAQEELERHCDNLEELVQRQTAELRRANQDLEDERDFTAAVLETAGALVVVVDREGRIVRFNRAAEQAALDKQRHFEISYRIATPAGQEWVWERRQGHKPQTGE
jgi:nitrogen fixation/metabolism regulation signal transduction histidine kinase